MTWTLVAIAAMSTAVVSGALSIASWRALVHTGNSKLSAFVIGFALLAVKNAMKAYLNLVDAPENRTVEALFSAADLLAVMIIAWPLMTGRRGP